MGRTEKGKVEGPYDRNSIASASAWLSKKLKGFLNFYDGKGLEVNMQPCAEKDVSFLKPTCNQIALIHITIPYSNDEILSDYASTAIQAALIGTSIS